MWRVIVVAALAAIVVACGSDDGGDNAAPEPTATLSADLAFTEEQARAAAESALLRLDDFPTGWTERPAEDDEVGLDLPSECEDQDYPGKVADADSPEFHGSDDEQVESGVTVYADESLASAAMAASAERIEDCREPLKEAIRKLFEEADDAPLEGIEAEVNVDRLSFPTFGDESFAWRISATSSADDLPFAIDFFLDVIAVRPGGILSCMTFVYVIIMPDLA